MPAPAAFPRYYIPTSREVQRIESVSRSPIYTKFAEAMLGVATIRAYRKEEHFTQVRARMKCVRTCAFAQAVRGLCRLCAPAA